MDGPLRQVEMGMVDHALCEENLRKTRLKSDFVLEESFICAGGKNDVDVCTGDGGGPLVCPGKDRGPNGDIYYQLVKGNGELFRVGRKSGLITLRTDLTEDYSSEYTLTIAAYDGGTPPYSAEIVVVIKVVDESVPLFEQQLYTASVKENVQPNTPLLDVKATSPTVDSITGL